MAKTKEEVQKVLTKNYSELQVKELNVYEEEEVLLKSFTKDVKVLKDELAKENKNLADSKKAIVTKYKEQLAEINKANKNQIFDVDKRKKEAINLYEKSLNQAISKQSTEIEKLNRQIDVIKKENEELVDSVLVQYNKDIDLAKKTIVDVNAKGVKDQNTFEQKIEDLKAKYIQKVEELKEKEQTKILKITENANSKVEKLQESIKVEREKLDHKLANLKPIYEEELAEIDENLSDAKLEYETKHESIRSSADQRIAVREKHMHRAMDENDQRSVKLHKKDIEKFRKEADRDLVLLRKNFNQDNAVALDYRKNFIKENFQKLANLERDYSNLKQGKQHEIDELLIVLATDIEKTKLDNEKVLAEELEKFNKGHAEIKEKQISVLKEQELDVEKQVNNQVVLRLNFEKENAINSLKLQENLEVWAKLLRDVDINKDKEDLLAKDILDNANLLLANELDIMGIKLTRDILVNEQNEKLELHNLQFLSQSKAKEEFLSYQQTLAPLHNSRANLILSYEELELDNRYKLKVAFLEKQSKEAIEDYNLIVAKINDVYDNEKVYFENEIQRIAGAEKEAYDTFLQTGEDKLAILKTKLEELPPKDKKGRRRAQEDLENYEKLFNDEKITKQASLDSSIKVYTDALKQADTRKVMALNEAKNVNDSENERLKIAIDLVKSNRDKELEDARTRLQETESSIGSFLTQAAERNQLNTEENQVFLDKMIDFEENIISNANSIFEGEKETFNNKLNTDTSILASAKENGINEVNDKLQSEETNLEKYKSDTASKIMNEESKNKELLNIQSNTTSTNNSQIESKCDSSIKDLKQALAEQNAAYKTHLQEISKKVANEKNNFDSETKRIQKEFEQRLKEEHHSIDLKLSDDIANIQYT